LSTAATEEGVNVPLAPDLLQAAGMDWRRIQPSDEKFVVDSWRASALRPFVFGHLALFHWYRDTVLEAQRQKNVRLLRRLFDAEMPRQLNLYLAPRSIVVIYDVENPTMIIGWGCAAYQYVKQAYRGQGLGRALREVFEAREDTAHQFR
jgi:GNAT superfamily N-acetyltransferase